MPRALCVPRPAGSYGAPGFAFAGGLAIGTTSAAAAGVSYRYDHGDARNDTATIPDATVAVDASTTCGPGDASAARDLPESEKLTVSAECGIEHRVPGAHEIDHLVSLELGLVSQELGGLGAVANPWPALADHLPGSRGSKEILEDARHRLVCSGHVELPSAPRQIASEWAQAFHRFLGGWPGDSFATTTPTVADPPVGASPP